MQSENIFDNFYTTNDYSNVNCIRKRVAMAMWYWWYGGIFGTPDLEEIFVGIWEMHKKLTGIRDLDF